REQAASAQALPDHTGQRIENASDLLAGEPRVFADVCQDFRLRRCATLFRHIALLLEFYDCEMRCECSRVMRIGAENSTCALFGKRFFLVCLVRKCLFFRVSLSTRLASGRHRRMSRAAVALPDVLEILRFSLRSAR